MLPFPIAFMTWRESIVGVQPSEMVHMQVEKNWVAYNPPATASSATGPPPGATTVSSTGA